MNQSAVIVAMVGSATTQRKVDPNVLLNATCAEGWEIVSGEHVFVTEGEQSRDNFLSSGQNVAVKGRVMAYYLFRRSEDNLRTAGEPAVHDQ